MKKSVALKSVFILILLCAALLASAVLFCGLNSKTANAESNISYAFNNSSVEIDVDENKVLHIKENLQIGFARRLSQISRSIPSTVYSYKNRGGKAVKGGKFLAEVKNAAAKVDGVTAQIEVEKNSASYKLTVTNPEGDFALWNSETDVLYNLELEYDYDLSDDGAGKSAFAFTALNYEPYWFYHNGDRNDISTLTVTVNMPKPFDGALAKVYSENGDITESAGLEVDGNSLTYSVSFKGIDKKQLRIALDGDYFDTHVTYFPVYWLFVGLVIIIMVISVILTVIYRGRKPIAPVEVEPPVINPLHYSAYWHGYPQRRDVTTIILFWARLGCIKITKDGKKDLILTRLKPLPEKSKFAERQYFYELFRYGNVFRSKDTRGFKNRARKDRIRFAVNSLVEESEKPTPFVPAVERTRMCVNVLSVIALTVMFVYFIMLNTDIISLCVIPLFIGIMLIPLVKLNSVFSGLNNLKQRDLSRFLWITFGILGFAMVPIGLFAWVMFYLVYLPQYDYIHMTVISLIWALFGFFILPEFIKKRTDDAQKLYGRMLGFKRFIQLADLPKMELLLKDNPEYFYDVLPYCMVMGLSKKIDRHMQYLGVAVPDWADGFNPANFAQELFYSVTHSIIVNRKKNARNKYTYDG